MTTIRNGVMAGALALATALAMVGPAAAGAFYGWQVTNVPAWDVLNVRTGPGTAYGVLVAYPNGTPLSMTGPCTKSLDLGAIAGWPDWRQRRAVRYRWCEVWLDPLGNGQFLQGWVYGRYIRPM